MPEQVLPEHGCLGLVEARQRAGDSGSSDNTFTIDQDPIMRYLILLSLSVFTVDVMAQDGNATPPTDPLVFLVWSTKIICRGFGAGLGF
ncbi:hypothetical protein [Herbaspirillum autotrophicum]|uniref:hypothetical protein n=1 Tax=Herbaspirillum autotrophicum TaxID=180195 RepID=UPI0012EE3D9D|nr:hypothetical protein [Herbaspirillum autotrophicum]